MEVLQVVHFYDDVGMFSHIGLCLKYGGVILRYAKSIAMPR